MRADLIDRTWARIRITKRPAVAARCNGARGAAPVTIDGERAAAWIMAGTVKVAFVFVVEGGLVREVELIADPDVLATLDVGSCSRSILSEFPNCCLPWSTKKFFPR